jgi:nicotinamidase-related amidase
MFRNIALFICDMQIKVLPHIKRSDTIVKNVNTLIEANNKYREVTNKLHDIKNKIDDRKKIYDDDRKKIYDDDRKKIYDDDRKKIYDDDRKKIYGYYGDITHEIINKKGYYGDITNTHQINKNSPIYVGELLPEKLGSTTPIILNNLPKIDTYISEKSTYSMFDRILSKKMRKDEIDTILLTGVQTEWCISQTAEDYKKEGYEVIVVSDAVGSTNEDEHKEALERLDRKDIKLTTCHGWIVDRLKTTEDPLSKWYVNKLKQNIRELK